MKRQYMCRVHNTDGGTAKPGAQIPCLTLWWDFPAGAAQGHQEGKKGAVVAGSHRTENLPEIQVLL